MPATVVAHPFDFIRFVPEDVLRRYVAQTSEAKRALLERVVEAGRGYLALDSGERELESEIYRDLLELDS